MSVIASTQEERITFSDTAKYKTIKGYNDKGYGREALFIYLFIFF